MKFFLLLLHFLPVACSAGILVLAALIFRDFSAPPDDTVLLIRHLEWLKRYGLVILIAIAAGSFLRYQLTVRHTKNSPFSSVSPSGSHRALQILSIILLGIGLIAGIASMVRELQVIQARGGLEGYVQIGLQTPEKTRMPYLVLAIATGFLIVGWIMLGFALRRPPEETDHFRGRQAELAPPAARPPGMPREMPGRKPPFISNRSPGDFPVQKRPPPDE